jgi:hypothetical protein
MIHALRTTNERRIQTKGHLFLHDDSAFPLSKDLMLPSNQSYMTVPRWGTKEGQACVDQTQHFNWLVSYMGWAAIEQVRPGFKSCFLVNGGGDQYYLAAADYAVFVNEGEKMLNARLFLGMAIFIM